jgi:hypothetical protein
MRADVLGAEIHSLSEANCLLLVKQKMSEVPMFGLLDRICRVNGRLVAMRGKILSGIIIGELVVAHAALVGKEGELWVALLAVVADDAV